MQVNDNHVMVLRARNGCTHERCSVAALHISRATEKMTLQWVVSAS